MIETHASDSPTVPGTANLRGFQKRVRMEIETAQGQNILLLLLRFLEALLAYIIANPLPTASPATAPAPDAAPLDDVFTDEPWSEARIARAAAHMCHLAMRDWFETPDSSPAQPCVHTAGQSIRQNHPIIISACRTTKHKLSAPDRTRRRRKTHQNFNAFARLFRYDIAMTMRKPHRRFLSPQISCLSLPS